MVPRCSRMDGRARAFVVGLAVIDACFRQSKTPFFPARVLVVSLLFLAGTLLLEAALLLVGSSCCLADEPTRYGMLGGGSKNETVQGISIVRIHDEIGH